VTAVSVSPRVGRALAGHGLSWDSVRRQLGCGPGDVLVAGGSLVLPFEAGSDDVDLLLVTRDDDTVARYAAVRSPERRSEQIANGYVLCYRQVGGTELDLELWSRSVVERVAADLGEGVAGAGEIEADFTRFGGLDRKVGLDLLHTLLLGEPDPACAGSFNALRAGVCWTRYFSWNRDVHLIHAGDAAKGVRRSLRDGELAEAHLKACWGADNLVDGLIFDGGYSISRWKWRLRFLPFIDGAVAEWYRRLRFRPPDRDRLEEAVDLMAATVAERLGRPPAALARTEEQRSWTSSDISPSSGLPASFPLIGCGRPTPCRPSSRTSPTAISGRMRASGTSTAGARNAPPGSSRAT
jgi:hypothetical protein